MRRAILPFLDPLLAVLVPVLLILLAPLPRTLAQLSLSDTNPSSLPSSIPPSPTLVEPSPTLNSSPIPKPSSLDVSAGPTSPPPSSSSNPSSIPDSSSEFTPIAIAAVIASGLLVLCLMGVIGYRLYQRRLTLSQDSPSSYQDSSSHHRSSIHSLYPPSPPSSLWEGKTRRFSSPWRRSRHPRQPSSKSPIHQGSGARPRADTFESYTELPPISHPHTHPHHHHHHPLSSALSSSSMARRSPASLLPHTIIPGELEGESMDWASGSITEGYSLSIMTQTTLPHPHQALQVGGSHLPIYRGPDHGVIPLPRPPQTSARTSYRISETDASTTELLSLRHRSDSDWSGKEVVQRGGKAPTPPPPTHTPPSLGDLDERMDFRVW
ncbi:MAG: hypothetical protein DHS80DRAFT_21940 [Piptocephalis tieghemiana]|nr:MAG: hypothetical protein DHS80DRAFT_21940 [Piptocephalis tieghemiana]